MVSLPSRGAWIEIISMRVKLRSTQVAPLAGSVDRNTFDVFVCHDQTKGRSPRGERG